MMIRAVRHIGTSNSSRCLLRLVAVAVVAILLGCASTGDARKEPTPRDDFKEYRQLVAQAMGEVDAALRALEEISVQANRDPREAYAAFAKSVHRLEVDSIRLRARVQAMRARGDAYFEHWEKYLAGVDNEQVRQLAEQHRPELRQSFAQAQQASQQVRELFRPFLSDLQKVRAVLDAEPTLARVDAAKSLIAGAEDKGRQVQQALDRLLAEMNSMTAMLRPPDFHPRP